MNRQEILDEAIGMAQGNNAFSEPDYIDGFLAAAAPREELIAELVGALREVSWTLAKLTLASGDFSAANAKAIDTASAALAKAEARQ